MFQEGLWQHFFQLPGHQLIAFKLLSRECIVLRFFAGREVTEYRFYLKRSMSQGLEKFRNLSIRKSQAVHARFELNMHGKQADGFKIGRAHVEIKSNLNLV